MRTIIFTDKQYDQFLMGYEKLGFLGRDLDYLFDEFARWQGWNPIKIGKPTKTDKQYAELFVSRFENWFFKHQHGTQWELESWTIGVCPCKRCKRCSSVESICSVKSVQKNPCEVAADSNERSYIFGMRSVESRIWAWWDCDYYRNYPSIELKKILDAQGVTI